MCLGVSVPSYQAITPDALGIGQHFADRDNHESAQCGGAVVSKLQQILGHLHEVDRRRSWIELDCEYEPAKDTLRRGGYKSELLNLRRYQVLNIGLATK